MKALKFDKYKDMIVNAIQEKLKENPIFPEEDFVILEGFFNQPIQNEIAGKIIIGGPTLPMVAIVGKKTARIYFFALRVLLPNLEL